MESVGLGGLARRLDFSIALLVEEARVLGIPVGASPSSFLLSQAECDSLTEFVSHYQQLQKQPWKASDYVPRADGRIRLSDYDLLDVNYRQHLLNGGYLPIRRDVVAHPNRSWPQVQQHFHLRIDQNRAAVKAKLNVLTEQSVAVKARGSQDEPNLARMLDDKISANETTSRPKRGFPAANSSISGMAIVPPKDPAVAALRSQRAQRTIARELNPERTTSGASSRRNSDRPTVHTAVGIGAREISQLTNTLGDFSPKDHAVLFDQFRRVVKLDRKIRTALATDQPQFEGTKETLLGVMSQVFVGKFGLFAYHDVGNAIAEKTRRNSGQVSEKTLIVQTKKLLPMSTGLLTDLGRSRFIFWSIERNISICIVRFQDLASWLEGMFDGKYQALVGEQFTLKSGVGLDDSARTTAAFLAEAANMLRAGYKIRRVQEKPNAPLGRNYFAGKAATPSRVLSYKPQSSWLVPITIEGDVVSAGLGEDFFIQHGAKIAHSVRETMRRPAGSHRNAEKTIRVKAHTRGGYDVGEVGFMPTVTIMRKTV
ncbi:hypothetical protein [Arthrobacter sp. TWP1-1]|uniref:hypothetical protein n=1 Tax=Arthrobacter sp. TWP1-1 TaxID=2804568 RepID=UPI003CF11AFA